MLVTVVDTLIHARREIPAGGQFETTTEHAELLLERGLITGPAGRRGSAPRPSEDPPAGDPPASAEDLSTLKRPQLLERAKTLGVEVPSGPGVKNSAIVELLEAAIAERATAAADGAPAAGAPAGDTPGE